MLSSEHQMSTPLHAEACAHLERTPEAFQQKPALSHALIHKVIELAFKALLIVLPALYASGALAAESSGVTITKLSRELAQQVDAVSVEMEIFQADHAVLDADLKQAIEQHSNADNETEKISTHASVLAAASKINRLETQMIDSVLDTFAQMVNNIDGLRKEVQSLKTGGHGNLRLYRQAQIRFQKASHCFANLLENLGYVEGINPQELDQLKNAIVMQSQVNEQITTSTNAMSTDGILSNLDSLETQISNLITVKAWLSVEKTFLSAKSVEAVAALVSSHVQHASNNGVVHQISAQVFEAGQNRSKLYNNMDNVYNRPGNNKTNSSAANSAAFNRILAGDNLIKE